LFSQWDPPLWSIEQSLMASLFISFIVFVTLGLFIQVFRFESVSIKNNIVYYRDLLTRQEIIIKDIIRIYGQVKWHGGAHSRSARMPASYIVMDTAKKQNAFSFVYKNYNKDDLDRFLTTLQNINPNIKDELPERSVVS
jgi:hypothetical protein